MKTAKKLPNWGVSNDIYFVGGNQRTVTIFIPFESWHSPRPKVTQYLNVGSGSNRQMGNFVKDHKQLACKGWQQCRGGWSGVGGNLSNSDSWGQAQCQSSIHAVAQWLAYLIESHTSTLVLDCTCHRLGNYLTLKLSFGPDLPLSLPLSPALSPGLLSLSLWFHLWVTYVQLFVHFHRWVKLSALVLIFNYVTLTMLSSFPPPSRLTAGKCPVLQIFKQCCTTPVELLPASTLDLRSCVKFVVQFFKVCCKLQ